MAVEWPIPMSRAGSGGRCTTIWYKVVFKGGVYDPGETVWAFPVITRDFFSTSVGAHI
jgi:hypothetical protein